MTETLVGTPDPDDLPEEDLPDEEEIRRRLAAGKAEDDYYTEAAHTALETRRPPTEKYFDPDQADKIVEAVELRRQHYSYREIAKMTGCSVATAHGRVQKALRHAVIESATDLMKLEMERTEELEKIAYGIARTGKTPDQQLRALDRCISLMERKSKLLGLDAPIRTETTLTVETIDAQIAQLQRELQAAGALEQGDIIDVESVEDSMEEDPSQAQENGE